MFKLIKKIFKVSKIVLCKPKGWFDFLLDIFSFKVRSSYILGKPVHLTIEPVNLCNLQCPVCETGAGILNRPKGRMNLDNFKKIIDQVYSFVNTILFYYMGEPFLNKDSYEMIKYAKSKNIFVTTCTNGDVIDPEKLVESGIDEVSFQTAGITQETHSKYRVGSNLQKILDNVRKTVAEKKRRNVSLPKIILGFIIMKHNEHEVAKFYQLAKDLEVDEAQILPPCVRNIEQARGMLPSDEKYWLYDRAAFEKGVLRPKAVSNNKSCPWIWYSTLLTWDGNVLPCCRDAQGEYVMGNIFQENLVKIWNNKIYREFRKKFLDGKTMLCSLCQGYGIIELK